MHFLTIPLAIFCQAIPSRWNNVFCVSFNKQFSIILIKNGVYYKLLYVIAAASSVESSVPVMLPFDEDDMIHCFDEYYLKKFRNSMYWYKKHVDFYCLVCTFTVRNCIWVTVHLDVHCIALTKYCNCNYMELYLDVNCIALTK